MKVRPFEMERWQSVWENRVELNISESGVKPMTLEELVDDPVTLRRVLATPLGYPQTNGSEETRAGVAALYPGSCAENVLLTNGGSEANYVSTWALVEPGDEVIFVSPNYMQITGVAQAFGALVKPLWLREELGWTPDVDELRRLLTPKTKLIAICNPNNPTGSVFGEPTIEAVCRAASEVGAWVLSDEIYRGAEQNGVTTATFWGRYERVLCTAGFSKAYGLPGLRIGWVVGPAEVVDKIWGYHDYTSISPSMLSDRLAALVLEPQRHARVWERTREIIRRHYPVLRRWHERHADALSHVAPAAGAIAWFALRGPAAGRSTAEFAETLRQKGVLLVPGEQFDMPGYLRIGFGYDAEKLQMALVRLSEALAAAKAAGN
jgi:hypothetical protein